MYRLRWYGKPAVASGSRDAVVNARAVESVYDSPLGLRDGRLDGRAAITARRRLALV